MYALPLDRPTVYSVLKHLHALKLFPLVLARQRDSQERASKDRDLERERERPRDNFKSRINQRKGENLIAREFQS